MCVHIRISDSRRIVAVSPSATASFSNNGRIGTAFEGPYKESPRTSSSAQHPPHQFHHSHNLPFHSPSPSEEEATLPVWKYSVRLSPWRQIFFKFSLAPPPPTYFGSPGRTALTGICLFGKNKKTLLILYLPVAFAFISPPCLRVLVDGNNSQISAAWNKVFCQQKNGLLNSFSFFINGRAVAFFFLVGYSNQII